MSRDFKQKYLTEKGHLEVANDHIRALEFQCHKLVDYLSVDSQRWKLGEESRDTIEKIKDLL